VGGLRRREIIPEVLVEHVADPVRADPQPPASRATGTSFFAVLREQYEADIRRQAEDIPFRQAPTPVGPQIRALVARLEDLVGRTLRPAEQRELASTWTRRGPLPTASARTWAARPGSPPSWTCAGGTPRVRRLLRNDPPTVHRRGSG
jgi:hypothetical protein